MIPKKIDVSMPLATGIQTFYAVLPCRCTVLDVQLVASIDPGDAETVTVTSGSTAIGVVAFGATSSAGDVGDYTADETTGNTVLEKGATLKFVTTDITTASHLLGYVELDQFARTS